MAADQFTWPIATQPTGTETAALKKAQFGDGYKQVAQDGINNVSGSWPITVSGPSATVIAALNFLRAQAGASFLWTPPKSAQGRFSCAQWSLQPMGGDAYILTATFEQAFAP